MIGLIGLPDARGRARNGPRTRSQTTPRTDERLLQPLRRGPQIQPAIPQHPPPRGPTDRPTPDRPNTTPPQPRAVAVMFAPACTATAAVAFTLMVVAVVLNSHAVKAGGIQCFECNSHTDKECAQENLPDKFKKNCAEDKGHNYTVCRKMIQTIESEVNGLPSIKNRITRSCGWVESTYNDKCYHRSGFGGKQDVCTCSTDYCNSAQNTYIAFATVMVASFAILIL